MIDYVTESGRRGKFEMAEERTSQPIPWDGKG